MQRLVGLLIVLFLMGAGAHAEEQAGLDLKNARQVSDTLTTGGQPTKEDLRRLREAGYTTVINLRRAGETTKKDDPAEAAHYNFDEAGLSASLGLNYYHMPISSKDGLTAENAKLLDDLLTAAPGPVLLHCGSGNRAGALMALRAFHVQGMAAEDALAVGKAAGLTSLEAKVRAELGLPALED